MSHSVVVLINDVWKFDLPEWYVRDIIFHRQGGGCFYCDDDLQPGWHLDHVWPVSRGGTNSLSNYVAACPFCNRSKNDFVWPELLAIQERLANWEAALVEHWLAEWVAAA